MDELKDQTELFLSKSGYPILWDQRKSFSERILFESRSLRATRFDVINEQPRDTDRPSRDIGRVNSEKFQTFIFKPKLSFLMENHKNDN